MRAKAAVLSFFLLGSQTGQNSDPNVGHPTTGQPAAEVLASHDGWGNPTFIGGLTNAGPRASSVW